MRIPIYLWNLKSTEYNTQLIGVLELGHVNKIVRLSKWKPPENEKKEKPSTLSCDMQKNKQTTQTTNDEPQQIGISADGHVQ